MDQMFFNGWQGLLRTLIVGVLAYVVLIVFLRISGKRTLSKLNAFDFVVTVALGSTLATILLNKNVALAEGATAFAVLIGLQFLVTWSSVKVPQVRHIVTGEPRMLFYRGDFLEVPMRRDRVSAEEVRTAIRMAGLASQADALAVVLETDGTLSVIRPSEHGHAPILEGVEQPAGTRQTPGQG